MRRFSLFFFIAVFCTANAIAVTPVISRTIPTKSADSNVESRDEKTTTTNRATTNISRNISRNKNADVATRNTSKQSASRSVNTRTKSSGATLSDAVNTVGRSARTEAASINNTAAVRRAGITLRASTAEVGGRATIGNSDVQTGSNIDEQVRGVQSRSALFGAKQKTVTAESLAAAKDLMEKTNDLNSICQQQYNECMDQFCAVVDANQKRCSCSANLAKYAKAQEAVEEANTELNDVAQRIRYVGLSADEIRAIMTATEAELEMGKTKDNTTTRSMLDDIADMIKDPTGSITLSASSSDSLLDMDLDFSSDSADAFSLDLFSTNTNDISSKRGTALYREATKRCKTVLNQCKDAGGTESQITGNYDLAIAKDCVAYEQGLEKLNQTLKNNVRSANLMLQKARLAVLQNKNEYDAKGCIGALEKCMLDDMVCGEDYLKCLDPTKRYIDENGNVVLGKNIANITDFMTEYNNTNFTSDFVKASSGDTTCSNHDGACIVNYLMQKIGTGASVKDGGLCRPVLDKCQYYTYDNTGKTAVYKPYNEIVINYVQRAMVNIKAAQAKIISDYASSCMADVQECYSQQNSQITSWSTTANIENIYKVMTGACYNVALTCGYAVFAYDREMGAALQAKKNQFCSDHQNDPGVTSTNDGSGCEITNSYLLTELQKTLAPELINGISELFYQSLLCPDNSYFANVAKSASEIPLRYVNDRCICKTGYEVAGTACVLCDSGQSCVTPESAYNSIISYSPSANSSTITCPENASVNTLGGLAVDGFVNANCRCDTGYKVSGGQCVSTCAGNTYTYGQSCVTSCPSDTYIQNGACVSECDLNYMWNTNTRVCTQCPNGYYGFPGACNPLVYEGYCALDLNGQTVGDMDGGGDCDLISSFNNGQWYLMASASEFRGNVYCSNTASNHTGTGGYCWVNISGTSGVFPAPTTNWVLYEDMGSEANCKANCIYAAINDFVLMPNGLRQFYK